jgi:putative transposase
VRTLATVLGISRQRVYALKKSKDLGMYKIDEAEDRKILQMIEELVKQYPFYGYRKITAILQYQRGLLVNRKRVYRIMK